MNLLSPIMMMMMRKTNIKHHDTVTEFLCMSVYIVSDSNVITGCSLGVKAI